MLRERIRQLERRDERKRATERKEEIARQERIKRKSLCIRHEQRTHGKEATSNDTAEPGPEMVEDRPDWERSNVGPDRSNGEHEVEADLDTDILGHVAVAAHISVCALELEDGLEGSIAKDDAS